MIAISAGQIGRFFRRFSLPLVSGFLLAGIAAGPFVLNLVPEEANRELRFVEEISLAFIAFAAGSELYLKELRSRMRSIRWVTIGQSMTFIIGASAVFLLARFIPFADGTPTTTRLAIALLAGAILVARSPSSAIAIVNELRAKGPFTQTAMGVTVVMDLVVIVLFAINTEIADALLTDVGFSFSFVALLLIELALSLVAGMLVALLLTAVLSLQANYQVKAILVLLIGYSVYPASFAIRDWTHAQLPFELLMEPLLICMVGSFLVTNRTAHRNEFLRLLSMSGPSVYVVFFTLTGINLQLDILAQTWRVALILFVARLIGIFLGTFLGGALAADPIKHNALGWMAYVTQAGVGLGLSREVAVEFPEFGASFATLLISVIVINQILGPPFFKLAINRVGEAHPRAPTPAFDGIYDAIIFGFDDQAAALARQLNSHGWETRIACLDRSYAEELTGSELDVRSLSEVSLSALDALEIDKADAVIALLTDEENYQICELIYEHVGTPTMVARLTDWGNSERFRELGVLTVHPATAVVGLLDHFVRAPSTASLLLGTSEKQDIVDIEVRDSNLDGVTLRDLRLPLDTLILSLQRDGQTIITHGYTRLRVGDCVTVVGSTESLDQIALRFGL